MRLMSDWLPKSLAGRTASILVAGLLVAQLASFLLHVQDRAALMGKGHLHGMHGWAGLPPGLALLLALVAVGVVLASLVAMRWASRPLEDLATAATTFAHDLDAPPLPETGPTEIRRAAAAFNFMQGRLKKMVLERGRALAAVSHDLRTPLTRMRLRVELVEDAALREKLDADIDAMTSMVDGVLAYLRGIEDAEPVRPVDMLALVQSIVEDEQATGHAVRFALAGADQAPPAPLMARTSLLRRAVSNLVGNAVVHGHSVVVTLHDSARCVRIVVEDDGPGIPPGELRRVLEPFVRLDTAQGAASGGAGLGLAIARDAAALHGGELALENRTEGGLRASLLLPRQ